MTSWVSVVSGGVGGGLVTFVLTSYREHRRSAEVYRAPQRQAIADIATANDELQIAIEALLGEIWAVIDPRPAGRAPAYGVP